MIESPEVAVEVATPQHAAGLANLLELYAHDLSAVFALDVKPDGRFGYEKLPLYWSEPEHRFPFLLRCDGKLAGFALITRGSPVSDDPETFDVAEFFVVRRFRRSGVGRKAAFLLWSRFPKRWTVRVSDANHSGCDFWSGVVAEYTDGMSAQTTLAGARIRGACLLSTARQFNGRGRRRRFASQSNPPS